MAVNATPRETSSVLFIEDDAVFAGEMVEMFESSGMAARSVGDWPSALALLEDWSPDLIVLDQRLGAVDTLLMLPELRRLTAAPVLFLTGNRAEADRIIGLELGADDFLLKPIAGRELVARARAHLRRVQIPVPTSVPMAWRIVPERRELERPGGAVVPLTSSEYSLLALLASKPGEAVDRDHLTREVLQRPYRAEDRAIDNLVHQIRRKVGPTSSGEVIVSVRSQGYAFKGFPPK